MTPAALDALLRGDTENFVAAATLGGIEAQEKQGQMDQAFAETLPLDMGGYKPVFEQLGFVFGKPVDGIFIEATFPKGWRKKLTDHSMWTKLVDNKGRERGGIFYKAAFYDRSAYVSLSRRFGVASDYGKETGTVFVSDACGKVDKKLTGFLKPDWSDREEGLRRSALIDAASEELRDWLTENYPGWQDVSEYWE